MPYILISTTDIEKSVTSVFDGHKDDGLMEDLLQSFGTVAAQASTFRGQPLNVLNLAERRGYSVISTVVQGNTIIWTLHKE